MALVLPKLSLPVRYKLDYLQVEHLLAWLKFISDIAMRAPCQHGKHYIPY